MVANYISIVKSKINAFIVFDSSFRLSEEQNYYPFRRCHWKQIHDPSNNKINLILF